MNKNARRRRGDHCHRSRCPGFLVAHLRGGHLELRRVNANRCARRQRTMGVARLGRCARRDAGAGVGARASEEAGDVDGRGGCRHRVGRRSSGGRRHCDAREIYWHRELEEWQVHGEC